MYKASIIFLFLILGNISVSRGATEEIYQREEINLDSICYEILSMPLGKARVEKTTDMLRMYNFKKESDLLLSILRQDTPKFKDSYMTLQLYFYEILAAKRDNDLPKANNYLNKMKALCITEQDYEVYFNSITIIVHETIQLKHFAEAYDIIQKAKKQAQEINNRSVEYLITKCLIYYYDDTENYEQEKKIIISSINDEDLSSGHKRELYGYLASVYTQEEEYKKALEAIDKSIKFKDDNGKNSLSNSTVMQSILIKKLGLLLKMNNISQAKSTINRINNETDTTLLPKITRFNYFINLAKYYYITEDYDKSMEALECLSTNKVYITPYITKQFYMASVLYKKGLKKEASELFVKTLEESLEHKTQLIEGQREVSNANTRIQQILISKMNHEKHRMNTWIVFAVIILLIFSISIYRFFIVGRELKRTVEATHKAAIIAKENDTKKDDFLRRMTNEIEIPLNKVNRLTEILANNRNVSIGEKKEYSSQIKVSSNKLLNLVTSVLDLSRLESGMMKYSIDRFDLVQLCRENIIKAEYKNKNLKISFICQIDSLKVVGDVSRFNKMIFSLIYAPNVAECEKAIRMKLVAIEKTMFSLIIENSPLLIPDIEKKEKSIQTQINSLFVETFNGSYYTEERKVVITMPLNNLPKDIIIVEDNSKRI